MCLQVMAVAWLIATVFYLCSYLSPCRRLPSEQALGYYEAESELDDFYAGGVLTDRRGLKHFPRLWCTDGEYSSWGQLFFTPLIQQVSTRSFSSLRAQNVCQGPAEQIAGPTDVESFLEGKCKGLHLLDHVLVCSCITICYLWNMSERLLRVLTQSRFGPPASRGSLAIVGIIAGQAHDPSG